MGQGQSSGVAPQVVQRDAEQLGTALAQLRAAEGRVVANQGIVRESKQVPVGLDRPRDVDGLASAVVEGDGATPLAVEVVCDVISMGEPAA
jgi:hypothetical protein